jgi:hypothetical protein
MNESPGQASHRRIAELVVSRARDQGRDILAELDLLEHLGSHGRMTPAMAQAIRAAASAQSDVDGRAR